MEKSKRMPVLQMIPVRKVFWGRWVLLAGIGTSRRDRISRATLLVLEGMEAQGYERQ